MPTTRSILCSFDLLFRLVHPLLSDASDESETYYGEDEFDEPCEPVEYWLLVCFEVVYLLLFYSFVLDLTVDRWPPVLSHEDAELVTWDEVAVYVELNPFAPGYRLEVQERRQVLAANFTRLLFLRLPEPNRARLILYVEHSSKAVYATISEISFHYAHQFLHLAISSLILDDPPEFAFV